MKVKYKDGSEESFELANHFNYEDDSNNAFIMIIKRNFTNDSDDEEEYDEDEDQVIALLNKEEIRAFYP